MPTSSLRKRAREEDEEDDNHRLQPRKKIGIADDEKELLDALSKLEKHVALVHNLVTSYQKMAARSQKNLPHDLNLVTTLEVLRTSLNFLAWQCDETKPDRHNSATDILTGFEHNLPEPSPALMETISEDERTLLQVYLNLIKTQLQSVIALYKPLIERLTYPPSADSYAQSTIWPIWQKQSTAILNLRPSQNQGLPLSILHTIFAEFRAFMAEPPPKTDSLPAAYCAAQNLCSKMADSFRDDEARQNEFQNRLMQFLGHHLDFINDFTIDPGLNERDTSIADSAICWGFSLVGMGVFTCDIGEGDAYMQVSRIYQSWINRRRYVASRSSFLAAGAPMVLICVMGPLLVVAGGFYDGNSTVVEPLTSPYLMLPDHSRERQEKLAHLLLAIGQALESIAKLWKEDQHTTIPPGAPRIYPQFTDFAGTVFDLKFTKRILGSHPDANLLFLATVIPPSSTQPEREVFVKLVAPGQYGTIAQQKMAKAGYAPMLYGVVEVKGAPTAYIMEYLSPEQGWETVHEYITKNKGGLALGEFDGLLGAMTEANVVHGNLRPNNMMVRRKDGGFEFKMIDFNSSGLSGEVEYPFLRNENIPWPDEAGKPIVLGHDQILLRQSFDELLSKLQ